MYPRIPLLLLCLLSIAGTQAQNTDSLELGARPLGLLPVRPCVPELSAFHPPRIFAPTRTSPGNGSVISVGIYARSSYPTPCRQSTCSSTKPLFGSIQAAQQELSDRLSLLLPMACRTWAPYLAYMQNRVTASLKSPPSGSAQQRCLLQSVSAPVSRQPNTCRRRYPRITTRRLPVRHTGKHRRHFGFCWGELLPAGPAWVCSWSFSRILSCLRYL